MRDVPKWLTREVMRLAEQLSAKRGVTFSARIPQLVNASVFEEGILSEGVERAAMIITRAVEETVTMVSKRRGLRLPSRGKMHARGG